MAKCGRKLGQQDGEGFFREYEHEVEVFVLACDEYRKKHGKRFLAYSDFFAVLHDVLGYRRGEIRIHVAVTLRRTGHGLWQTWLIIGNRRLRIAPQKNRRDARCIARKLVEMLQLCGVPAIFDDHSADEPSHIFWGGPLPAPEPLPSQWRAKDPPGLSSNDSRFQGRRKRSKKRR